MHKEAVQADLQHALLANDIDMVIGAEVRGRLSPTQHTHIHTHYRYTLTRRIIQIHLLMFWRVMNDRCLPYALVCMTIIIMY